MWPPRPSAWTLPTPSGAAGWSGDSPSSLITSSTSPCTTTRSGCPLPTIVLSQQFTTPSAGSKPYHRAVSLQVLPDYLKGLFTVLPPTRPGEQHFQQVAKLAALQHRAKDGHHLPTM